MALILRKVHTVLTSTATRWNRNAAVWCRVAQCYTVGSIFMRWLALMVFPTFRFFFLPSPYMLYSKSLWIAAAAAAAAAVVIIDTRHSLPCPQVIDVECTILRYVKLSQGYTVTIVMAVAAMYSNANYPNASHRLVTEPRAKRVIMMVTIKQGKTFDPVAIEVKNSWQVCQLSTHYLIGWLASWERTQKVGTYCTMWNMWSTAQQHRCS